MDELTKRERLWIEVKWAAILLPIAIVLPWPLLLVAAYASPPPWGIPARASLIMIGTWIVLAVMSKKKALVGQERERRIARRRLEGEGLQGALTVKSSDDLEGALSPPE